MKNMNMKYNDEYKSGNNVKPININNMNTSNQNVLGVNQVVISDGVALPKSAQHIYQVMDSQKLFPFLMQFDNKVSEVINETGSNSISVTVDVEMVKEPSEPISGTVAADIQVLDKNGGVIVEITGWDSNNATFKGQGSIGTFTGKIKTNEGMPASKVVKNARFVRLTDVEAWKKEK